MRVTVLPLICMAVISLNAEKPFNFADTPGKLPKNIRPLAYTIRIEPDLARLTFTGTETVRLNFDGPSGQLIFNAVEITINAARVDNMDVALSAVKNDSASELVTLSLPHELQPGEHKLELKFTGRINQFGRGLYYAKYQEQGSGTRKMLLGTQFEATDARRFFPCWDEPVFRATFQLTAVVPKNWMAVSNMPIATERKIAAGREVTFQPTPLMSSYLNVFCAGEFDSIESQVDGTKLRIVTTKGKSEQGRYALESTAQILHYYNEYFGEPYPLPKLDQIAIPGGFGGAMENWGGITYYETALLFDPQNSSTATKQRVFEVIAHEVAHQWFGDLVTMAWWDNLWLNEGFASWMGTKCTAHFNPQWEVWLEKSVPRDPARRIGIPKEQAMEGDARTATHPIQQPIATEAEANNAFDDITYKKGQSFLRMLENFLSDAPFRDGIRRYIQAHKYSNSTTADLWDALTKASGKPILQIAAAWTEQPGFPLLAVKRENNDRVSLSQQRFTIGFDGDPGAIWQIPLTYNIDGQSAPVAVLMTQRRTELTDVPDDRALKLNVDGAGNYRVAYDDHSWKLLMGSLPGMNVPDKVNLLGDAWALVQAGQKPFAFYTDLIARLPSHTGLAVQEQIINAFDFINHLLAGTPEQEHFRGYARATLRPTLDALSLIPRPNEPPTLALLRASVVQELGILGDNQIIAACREQFANYLTNQSSVPPDVRAPILAIAIRYGDATMWRKLHELGMKTTSTEEKQICYDALAFTADQALIKKTLAIALTDELPTSRAVSLVAKVARESDKPELAWKFAQSNFKALLAKMDALGANSYIPSLFTFFNDPKRIDELQRFAADRLSKGSERPIEMARDEIRFRSDLRARLLKDVADLPQLSAGLAHRN